MLLPRKIYWSRLGIAFLTGMSLVLPCQRLVAQLVPWAENPWYWSYAGKPVLLLGGSDDDNLFQWPAEKLIPQLDRIQMAGGNVIRNTMSDRKDAGFEVYPFLQLESGKYDLSKWNGIYWERFERLLKETQARQIFIQIEIWDRFDYTDNRANDPRRWQDHPYAPENNINYSGEESTLAAVYPRHPGANDQPFFYTTPGQRNISCVLKFQEAFVHKLLDYTLDYDHILYCMDNETLAEPEWGLYWARLIKMRASAEGKSIMTTEMWDDWNLTAERHKQTLDHPDIYDFADVSQNNHNKSDKHWSNFIHVRDYVSKCKIRPLNTTKTYGADRNTFGHSDQDGIERFWRHLLAGAASIRFHRPDSGLGINDKAVACIRAARILESIVPLWTMHPALELLGGREENEAFCAAGSAENGPWILYFPKGGTVNLLSPNMDARASIQWIDIDRAVMESASRIELRNTTSISAPSAKNWAAVILKSNP